MHKPAFSRSLSGFCAWAFVIISTFWSSNEHVSVFCFFCKSSLWPRAFNPLNPGVFLLSLTVVLTQTTKKCHQFAGEWYYSLSRTAFMKQKFYTYHSYVCVVNMTLPPEVVKCENDTFVSMVLIHLTNCFNLVPLKNLHDCYVRAHDTGIHPLESLHSRYERYELARCNSN